MFGTTVTLLNVDTDEEVTCQIVGEDEADIKARLISITSPTARALIGKEPRRTGFATPSGIFVLQAGVMKKRFGAGYKPAPAGIAAFGISNVEGSVRIAVLEGVLYEAETKTVKIAAVITDNTPG